MKLTKLIWRNLFRRPARTLLSIGGVASAMTLLILVESLSGGMDQALSGADAARTLVVYRKHRFCPQTSFLPEWYAERIQKLDGVQSVLPIKVYLNNCRASLDLVAFQGAPVDKLLESRAIEVREGSLEQFRSEHDAALVGADFAARKGLGVGDTFRFGDIDVKVRGIFGSGEKIEESLILTHLEFLQRAGPVDRLGTVTQFEVKVADAERAESIAKEIDGLFASAEEPTDTRAQIAFLERATRDLREILRFGRILGLACVLVVLSLVANTVFMSVQERIREFGVFRTIGFKERQLATVVMGESLFLAMTGAVLGLALALVILGTTNLSIGTEGVVVAFATPPELFLRGLGIAFGVGCLAGLLPAVRSARRPIVNSLRSVT
ncbi:MAG: ABC transporter substrate-binding protein [Planctomycetes bacterium]|nr:ABC transporter substrate-binding protein [Planctomycetota bacterium]